MYAVEELERNLSRVDHGWALQVLQEAVDDPSEEVAKEARNAMALLFIRRRTSSLKITSMLRLEEADSAIDDYASIREAAWNALAPAVSRLHRIVMNPSAGELRGYAVKLLGRFSFGDSVKTVLECLDEPQVAVHAARALGWMQDERILPVLKKKLASARDEELRCEIILSMASLAPRDETVLLLASEARGASRRIRLAVARALGRIPTRKAVDECLVLAMDEDDDVAVCALDSLAILREASSAARIVELAEGSGSARRKAKCVSLLGVLGDESVRDFLFSCLEERDVRVLADAVESLSMLGLSRKEVEDRIVPLLSHPNNRVRANAVLAVYQYEGAKAVSVLNRMFTSPEREMRMSAAYAAGRIATRETLNMLVSLLQNESDDAVILSALSFLERVRSRDAQLVLPRLFKHPDVAVRSMAVRVYASISDERAMDTLYGLLKGEKIDSVRSAIISAMGMVCTTRNFMVLTRLLSDRNARVVANAVEALDRLGCLEVTSFIAPLLTHHSSRVKANVIVALWRLGDLKALEHVLPMLDASGDENRVKSGLYVLKQVADSLHPFVLRERPLLLSALRSRARLIARGVEKKLSLTDVDDVLAEYAGTSDDAGHGGRGEDRFLAAVVSSLMDGAELSMDPPPGTPYEYLAEHLGVDVEQLEDEEHSRLARRWSEALFLPGVRLLMEAARKRRSLGCMLEDYLCAYRIQLAELSAVLSMAENLLASGRQEQAQRIFRSLFSRVPLLPDVHVMAAGAAMASSDWERAFDELLKAFCENPGDVAAAIKLASVAARTGRVRVAGTLVRRLKQRPDLDDDTRRRVRRLEGLLLDGAEKKRDSAGDG